jgi:hypothetical protein
MNRLPTTYVFILADVNALSPWYNDTGVSDGSVRCPMLELDLRTDLFSWWQEGIESQAIDRCNRYARWAPCRVQRTDAVFSIGQKKPVHVYQLVAENTVESKVLDIQERKKKMIQEAFSGIKSNETQRQKKEARLQGTLSLHSQQPMLMRCRLDRTFWPAPASCHPRGLKNQQYDPIRYT